MSVVSYRSSPHDNQPVPATIAPSNMATQRFCLRWNNHQSNLLSVFDQLLHDESFVDVTLAVEGQFLRAHKMVLSACSPYFQALFINHPDKHPIVILKDVSYADMRSLLDFMYRGEVSVDQDRLTHFLRVAESLRIKGLTEVNEEKCDNIANSLSQQQNSNVPNLQRIQQQHQNKRLAAAAAAAAAASSSSSSSTSNTTSSTSSSFNMLGNYLMQPKRKRGNNSDGSTGKEDEEGVKVKEEVDEPVAGTSQESSSRERHDSDEMAVEDFMDCSQEENNQNHTNLPSSVTLDVVVLPQKQETVIISTEEARTMLHSEEIKAEPLDPLDGEDKTDMTLLPLPVESELSAGVHFLTDEDSSRSEEVYEKKKWDFLEYVPQSDGSVVCKRCGEVLASRTHWYRHKYKVHVNNFGNPSPLFKCEHCNVFFKSRKGFMGHYSTRHSETEPVGAEPSVPPTEPAHALSDPVKEDPAIESVNNSSAKKRFADKTVDWEAQRIKEEKLVADIISRVRRECEAQGGVVSRRGYSRRTTSVMNVNSQAC